ncbi:MAG TPA: sulfurtransferase [Thermoanaerobaculia bacterium]
MHPITNTIPPDAVLLDARPRVAYDAGHLPNAIHADPDRQLAAPDDPSRGGRHPLPPIERWAQQLGEWGIGPETEVVIYDEQSGANAAARAWWMLRAVGHETVAVLDGGMRAAGLALTTDVPAPNAREPYPVTTWKRGTVNIDEVDARREDPSWKVLDVRSTPRYRGETEPIDPIAGHIPGAVNLPYTENLDGDRFKDASALRQQYEHLLGDTPVDRLIVHCGSGVTACHTLLALEAAGLQGASLFVGSWSEWCRNDERPRAMK